MNVKMWYSHSIHRTDSPHSNLLLFKGAPKNSCKLNPPAHAHTYHPPPTHPRSLPLSQRTRTVHSSHPGPPTDPPAGAVPSPGPAPAPRPPQPPPRLPVGRACGRRRRCLQQPPPHRQILQYSGPYTPFQILPLPPLDYRVVEAGRPPAAAAVVRPVPQACQEHRVSLVPVSPRGLEPLLSREACPRSVSQAGRAGRAGGAALAPPRRRRQSPLPRWQEARRRGRRQASAAAARLACLPGQFSFPPSVPASSLACPALGASLVLSGARLPTTVSLAVPRAAPQEAAAKVSASFLPF